MKGSVLRVGAALLACAASASVCAFDIDDYFGARRVTDLALSSDGKQVIYAIANAVMPADDAPERTVYLQSLARNSSPAMVPALSGVGQLRWIPGTRRVSFVCKQQKAAQLCAYDTESGKTAVLTDSVDSVEKYAFAGDGRTLVYMTRPAVQPATSLYKRLLNDEPGVVIDTDTLSVYDFIDPNRAAAQFPPRATLWIEDPTGAVSQVPVPGDAGGANGSFHWSSDGALLSVTYVSADLPKSLLGQYHRTSLGVFDLAAKEFRVIGKAVEPQGSEPGVTYRGGEWVPGQHRLLVRRAIEVDPWVSPSFPQWSVVGAREPLPQASSAWPTMETYGAGMLVPLNDRRVLQETTVQGVESLFRLERDGVEQSAFVGKLDGGSKMFSFSADRKTVAFVNSSLTRPQEIYVSDAKGAVRPLTDLNAEIAKRIRFTAREVSWKSDDGTVARGWLLEPPGTGDRERRPWPMLTHVHGGPGHAVASSFGPYGGLWTYPFEVLAERGLAVFLPNYRGTKTYGRAFASPTSLSKEPVQDILSGIQSLIDSGIADRDQLAISGHSHGAWLGPLAMARGQPRGLKFVAGSFAEGMTNRVTMYALMSGDLNRQVHDALSGASFFDAPDRYLEDSPELAYRGLSTAVLFEAGATNLGIGMMSAAKATKHFGLPTEYVVYPRTGHNPFLSRVQREIAERNLDWFEFWMFGRVDPAPAKREQYERWSAARANPQS